jgi:hypothetical protein
MAAAPDATATAPTPRHRRRHHASGQERHHPPRARPRLHRLRQHLWRRGRDQLGDREPRQARGRQHEPRRRRFELARHGSRQLRRRRRHLRRLGGQLFRGRLRPVARPRALGTHRRGHHQRRCPGVLLELRHLPRPLRLASVSAYYGDMQSGAPEPPHGGAAPSTWEDRRLLAGAQNAPGH